MKKIPLWLADMRSAARRRIASGAWGVIVLMLTPAPLSAEEAETEPLEIIGDRPDFTESSATIPPIHLQGELGVAYSTIGDEELLTAPDLLLRLGLVDHLEARLGAPSFEASFDGSGVRPDAGGVEVGMKAAFDIGAKAALGVLPYGAVPVYRGNWRDTGVELGIKGLWAVDFTDHLSLGGNLGVIFEGVLPKSADFEPTYLASLSLGLSLFGWFGAFVEVYGLVNHNPDIIAVADGGFTFLVAQWLQLDLHAGVGLTPDARGGDVGAGAIFLI
jgi:hypothetical protein